jgi:raffinose/stachyose/melibiose transport system permease protein
VIDSIKTFDLIYTTTKGGPGALTEVFSFKVFQTMFTSYKVGYAAALSLVMLVFVTVISKWLVGKIR